MSDRSRPEAVRRVPAQRAIPSPTPRGASILDDARGEDLRRDPIGVANDGREVWETGTVESMARAGRR